MSSTKIISSPFDISSLSFDDYNGVILKLENINFTEQQNFKERLSHALQLWHAEGRKGIWIHASKSKSYLISTCIELGFEFHYVKDEILVLSKWLPDDVPSRLPLGPSHQVGVGAFVLKPNDSSQMLVVKEKTGPTASNGGLWKIPTGLVDPQEEIPDAAVRELLEETGLRGEMQHVVCFTQSQSQDRSSDLFFVCRMRLIESQEQQQQQKQQQQQQYWTPQDEEIADIQWMKVSDYCQQERFQESPAMQAMNECLLVQASGESTANNNGNGMKLQGKYSLGFVEGTNILFRT